MSDPFAKARGAFHGWWMVAVGGFIMVITSVPVFQATAVWAVALESQFGWSRTQLGLALSFTRVEGSLTGPIAGYLVDRMGTRFMVFTGLLVLAAGFFLFSRVENLWMFYLAYFIMSIGQGQAGWLTVMTLLNHWFVRRRGMAMGLAMVGMGIGALVLVPVIAWLINPDADRLGWRRTVEILAVVALVSAFVLPKLIRNKPEDIGEYPDGDLRPGVESLDEIGPPVAASSPAGNTQPELEFTIGQALRTQAFWCISFGHGFGSMVVLAIMSHLGLLLRDVGYGVQTTGWIIMVQTAVAIIFQFFGGWIGDRMPKNVALFIFTTIQGLGVVFLTLGPDLIYFYAFAVLFGIGFGGRTPLTTAIRGDYFGRASFGKILGISTVPMNVLLLIAAPLAGFMRDELGDYDMAFLLLAGLNMLGAVLFLVARKPRLPGVAGAEGAAGPRVS
ncbi:MAG: MFS transporter [Chloroflexi bacterium]|nr:MFS transporter [Chloroflexota bacterium]MCI0830769.1 MFS transporter [Chloroflexota bacterium]MCI0847561.1 MFS transporter [Chloroflexota bacterium]MCI0863282.1 MFS transporter [Chloroflexota bacterium]MCI0896757.1 MFS transporter [Chloroflexota bacterium]